MKKKIIGIIAVFAFVGAISFSVSMNGQNVLSDLVLNNVEALANGGAGGGSWGTGGGGDGTGCGWATREISSGWQAICINDGPGYECTCGSVKDY